MQPQSDWVVALANVDDPQVDPWDDAVDGIACPDNPDDGGTDDLGAQSWAAALDDLVDDGGESDPSFGDDCIDALVVAEEQLQPASQQQIALNAHVPDTTPNAIFDAKALVGFVFYLRHFSGFCCKQPAGDQDAICSHSRAPYFVW